MLYRKLVFQQFSKLESSNVNFWTFEDPHENSSDEDALKSRQPDDGDVNVYYIILYALTLYLSNKLHCCNIEISQGPNAIR